MNPICPNCGHELNIIQRPARWEILNSGLVRILLKAVIAVHKNNENRFHLQKDLTLSKTECCNAQKLRFHGLIAHADRENPKSGEWLVTSRAGQFLRGEIAVPRKVLVQDNQVLDHSNEVVHIRELRDRIPEFDPRYAYTPISDAPKVDQSATIIRSMNIYTWDSPTKFVTQVAFVSGEGSAFETAFNFVTNKAYTIRDGEDLPPGCLMQIPRDVFNEMLKGFAEIANERGMKLESDLKRDGKLEAMEKHLEDMRTLVFTPPRTCKEVR